MDGHSDVVCVSHSEQSLKLTQVNRTLCWYVRRMFTGIANMQAYIDRILKQHLQTYTSKLRALVQKLNIKSSPGMQMISGNPGMQSSQAQGAAIQP